MSVEAFWFAVVLLVALIVLPNAEPQRTIPDEAVVPAVVMDLLQGPDYRRDGMRK